jgi:autotransporter-associated beta strand protein
MPPETQKLFFGRSKAGRMIANLTAHVMFRYEKTGVKSMFPNARIAYTILFAAVISCGVADAALVTTAQIVPFAANDIVADPNTGALYASTSAGLTTINPTAGTIGSSYALAGNPGTIVITNNGSYVYAVAGGGNTVERFNLGSHSTDLTFNLPGTGTEQVQNVRNIYAIPGQPNSVLICRYYPGYSPPAGGTFIYQNGVALPNSVGTGLGEGGPDTVCIDETGQHAFGYNNLISSWSFYAMSLGSSGVTQIGGYASGYLSGNIPVIAVAGGKLFDNQGQIYNLLTGANVGSFTGGGNFFLDAADNEFYSVTSNGNSATLYAYNLTSLGLTGSTTISGISGSAGNLTRFGPSGLAFTTPTQVVGINTALVPFTWAAATGGTWSDGTRWTAGAAPNLTDAIANLAGSITQSSTVTVASPVTVGQIFFSNSNSYTVAGAAALTMQASSGSASLQVLLGSHAIAAPLVLATPTTILVNQPAATLTLSGPISGSGGLTCSGSGSVIMAAANSFAGGTQIAGGSLVLAQPLALQNSTVSATFGGGLNFAAGVTAPVLGGLSGNGNFALSTASSQAVALSVGQNGQNTSYSGALSGSGSLIKIGSGTLTMIGANLLAGGTIVRGGTMKLALPAVTNFGGNGAGWTVNSNGISSTPITNNVLTLTDNNLSEARSAFFNVPISDAAFTATYTYQASGNRAADGAAFVIQNDSRGAAALGVGGGSLGYAGITPSFAVEFNIYSPNGVGTAMHTGGAIGGYANTGLGFSNGDPIKAVVTYDGSANVTEQLTDLTTSGTYGQTFVLGSLPQLLGGNSFFVGFTGGDGGAASTQTISSFSLTSSGISSVSPAGGPLRIAGGATLDMSGIRQSVSSLGDDGSSGGLLILAGGSLTVGDGTSTTYSGGITGSGGTLTKVGSGTLLLAGSNNYTGPTAINQGELAVNGSLASPVTVKSGGVLAGTGSLSSVTINPGGQLAPGDAPGPMTIGGSLSLQHGAVMDYELGTLADSDEVLMPTGLLALNGQQFSDFDFEPLDGFGEGEYTLIEAGSISGALGANTSGTIDGLSATLAVQGDNLVLNVVPEPGMLALLAAGATLMAAYYLVPRSRCRPALTASQSFWHWARSAAGSLANSSESRSPARSGSVSQPASQSVACLRFAAGPLSNILICEANSACNHWRACSRQWARSASLRLAASAPLPVPAHVATQAAL